MQKRDWSLIVALGIIAFTLAVWNSRHP